MDLLHEVTSSLNYQLYTNQIFYNIMILSAQIFIDLEVILLMVISIMRVKNLHSQIFIGLFYGIRAIFLVFWYHNQNIEKLPYPPRTIWNAPPFPSLFVPYGITRDFFYSGHTGLMLFCILWWHKLKYQSLKWMSIIGLAQVIVVLIGTRVHYTIDILGAIIFANWLNWILRFNIIYFDQCFSAILRFIFWSFNSVKVRIILRCSQSWRFSCL